MAETLNFAAFPEADRLDKIAKATADGKVIKCGWVPFDDRTAAQNKAHEENVAAMPRFNIRGRFKADQRRYPLWLIAKKLHGGFLKYNHQQTGSCVGAGGGNMAKTLISVEISQGQPEEYRELWWPFTYGQSRLRSGMRSRGEGSTGSGWAQAATEDGTFEVDPEGLDTPDFKEEDGWLVIPGRTEVEWSAGPPSSADKFRAVGKKHLIKTAAPMKSADDCAEAIMNGYPLTQASNFGFSPMVPRPQGDPPVRLVTWNGNWAHQTYIDEYWDHPTLGEIFRWGNNWGPDAHGPALADEPPSSVYIRKKTMDELCRNGEVYAFSAYDGFPGRELSFAAF